MEIIENMFSIFKNKKILITGASGFKGSWLAIWMLELGAEVYGYSLSPKTSNDNFVITQLNKHINHLDGDVRDYKSLLSFFNKVKPDIAIHMAAQSLVLPSYDNPIFTYETNVIGTVNFFEAVRNTATVKAAINVTSDKCYENMEWPWAYRENDPMGGKDPYSASKGCSELITSSYIRSYFKDDDSANVASVRAGNVIGGGDWSEFRIIPDFYRSIENSVPLQLRNPNATRPWQFVLEPLRGYLMLLAKLYNDSLKQEKFQGSWNFGPKEENNVSVETLITYLIKTGGKGEYEILQEAEVNKEASFLKLDISMAKKHLSWQPFLSLKETIEFTIDGYAVQLANNSDILKGRLKQIQDYINKSLLKY